MKLNFIFLIGIQKHLRPSRPTLNPSSLVAAHTRKPEKLFTANHFLVTYGVTAGPEMKKETTKAADDDIWSFTLIRKQCSPVPHLKKKEEESSVCVCNAAQHEAESPRSSQLASREGGRRQEGGRCIDGGQTGVEKPVQMSHQRPSDAASVISVPRNASTGSPEGGQTFRSDDSSANVSDCPSRFVRLTTKMKVWLFPFSLF